MSNQHMLIYDQHHVLEETFCDVMDSSPFSCTTVTSIEDAYIELTSAPYTVLLIVSSIQQEDIEDLLKARKESPFSVFFTSCPFQTISIESFPENIFVDCVNLSEHKDLFLRKLRFINNFESQRQKTDEEKIRLQESLETEIQEKHIMERIAEIDFLTSVPNRRKINQELSRLYKQAIRYQQSLSILLIDIDDFKQINDVHGHSFGDEILVQFVSKVSGIFNRPFDILGRYGGDEFIVVLYRTDEGGASYIAEKIITATHGIEIQSPTANTNYPLTVSIGISTRLPTSDSTYETMINQCDEALYTAKESGKDQFIIYSNKR